MWSRCTAAQLPRLLHVSSIPSWKIPFPIKALQLGGGREFAAEFEQACQQKKLAVVRAVTQITEAQRSRGALRPYSQ
jgi:hypothetical protein